MKKFHLRKNGRPATGAHHGSQSHLVAVRSVQSGCEIRQILREIRAVLMMPNFFLCDIYETL